MGNVWALAGAGCAVSVVAAGVVTFVTLPIAPISGSTAAAGAAVSCTTLGAEAGIGNVAMHAKADEGRHILMRTSTRFLNISNSCEDVADQAQKDYDSLNDIKDEVDITQVFISEDTMSDWTDDVMPEVLKLEEVLKTVASTE